VSKVNKSLNVLTEEAFYVLARGGVVRLMGHDASGYQVEIILSDIGFDRMRELIDKAQATVERKC